MGVHVGFGETLGPSSQTGESVLSTIRGLKPGDVVVLRYWDRDHMVSVVSNKSENVLTYEGVTGWEKYPSRPGQTSWFFHEHITDIQILAEKDSYAAGLLMKWATEKYDAEQRLKRIDLRIAEEKAKLDKSVE